ncbi:MULTISPECIES: PDDEXK-like family protein [unclassified Sphingopyxis]|uniref:PDDEXK-like family protein n=1 Tax=Sphingopyxis sp. DBS4 TaxID=2968500 RepID=UPI00214C620D|nr:PD-(D/E)XK nuclease family protein [Sphingopyxis sp. DBS4]
MTEIVQHPSHADLENLFVNNTDIDRLEIYLNRFNPIRVMRMESMEVRHSNILGWLLDPSETHGLGDRFLRAFLAEAMKGESAKGCPTAIDIVQADLRDMEVRREWQHIDLFLLSRRNNWAFIVENKFHSSQHSGQLARYVEKVRTAFEPEEGRLDIKGIFLTLHDEDPEDASYASIGYDAICDLLPRVIDAEGQSLAQQVRIFIEHYIEIIREAAGMSEERDQMEQLARSLYRQHRKVLDFIWDYGSSTNFLLARDEVFGDDWGDGAVVKAGKISLVSFWSGGEQFSFLPLNWYEALSKNGHSWTGCENWWSGYPLICWMQLFQSDKGTEGSVRLVAEIGPLQNFELRKKLIEAIQAVAAEKGIPQIRFQKTASNEGKKYSKFLKDNSISINDVQDVEEISKAISRLLKNFVPCFDAVSLALDDFTN